MSRITIDDLQDDPRNPRRIDDRAAEGLRASLEHFGDLSGLTWNRQTGELVAGHQRLAALRAAATSRGVELRVDDAPGVEAVVLPAAGDWPEERFRLRVVDWDDDTQIAANIAANNPAIAGTFTADLQHLLDEVAESSPDLFHAVRFDELTRVARETLASTGTEAPEPESPGDEVEPPEPRVDRAAELQVQWQTAPGQVWEIPSKTVPGRCHRVACGDCRNPADVTRLLNGARVNVAFTSPPYASQRKYDEESGFRPIRPDDYVGWFQAVQENVKSHLAPDGSWFVNIKEHCEDGQRHLYVKDLTIAHVREWGWLFKDELIWKHHGKPGRVWSTFKNQFEPVFHMARVVHPKCRPHNVSYPSKDVPTGGGGWMADLQGTGESGGFEVAAGMAFPGNVLEVRGSDGKHPAAFPVGLPAFFIKAYSDPGDLVFDPFLGSGTTTVAAEREGRLGYGTELSPKYLGVILQRLADMGLEPRRIS